MQAYLSCSSRPIIENSTNIGFARYPPCVKEAAGIDNVDAEEWFVKELVEDFNWLRKEHSPNWRILDNEIKEDTWSKVMALIQEEDPSPQRLLQMVLK